MKRKKYLDRVIVFLVIFNIIFSVMCNPIVARADSNTRIQAYINLAAGKQISDVDVDSLNLSKRDLQFLGVYISNFFVPFGTEFGASSEDVTAVNKEDIQKALQTNVNFSDAMAVSITDNLIGLSQASIQELVLCVSKDYQKDLVEVSGSGCDVPLNYYTALTCMVGGLKNIAGWYDKPSDTLKGIQDGTYQYGYFAYKKGDKYVPMFDFKIDMSELTPSHSAFIKCMESVPIDMGYGFNFFDFTSSELGESEKDLEKLEEITDNLMYKMSIYNTKMAVDCFGNIILMGGNHQYVAVPGCMNPYTWSCVDEEGDDISSLGGTAYNTINIPSMSLVGEDPSSSNKLYTGISSKDSEGTVVDGNSSLKDAQVNMELFTTTYVSIVGQELEYIIDFCGGKYIDNEDITCSVEVVKGEDGSNCSKVSIVGKAGALSKIDTKKLTEEWQKGYIDEEGISKKEKNTRKGKVHNLNSSANLYRLYIEKSNLKEKYKGSKDVLAEVLKVIKREAIKSSKGDLAVSSNKNANNVRQFSINTTEFENKLSKVLWREDTNQYVLRKLRGSKDASLGLDIDIFNLFKDSTYRDLAIKAENGFKEANPDAKNFYQDKGDGLVDNFLARTETINIYGSDINLVNGEFTGSSIVDTLDYFVFVDNLGAAHFDDGDEEVEFSTFNVEHYLVGSQDVSSVRKSMSDWSKSGSNGFTNTFNDIKSGKMVIPDNTVTKEAMVGIYFTYAYAGLYDESNREAKKATIGELGYKINTTNLPEIPDEPLVISESAKSDHMLESIKGWIYYLLHPTEGLEYFETFIKNKITSFFLGWHDDMVGTRGVGSISGTTKYRGTSGYVTTPELTELPWTNSILNIYNSSIPFLIVAMIIIMVGAYVTGTLSFQKSVIGLMIFSICIALPPTGINGVVGTVNRLSSSMYGKKFTYWALIQHESYSTAIDEAAEGSSYSNYLKTLYDKNAEATGNQGSESVMIKWQAPKKMASLMLTEKDKTALDGFSEMSLLGGLINETYSGENYTNSDDVYFYRSYIDIANFSRYIHRGLTGSNPTQPVNMELYNEITDSWDESLQKSVQDYNEVYEADRNLGYANLNGDGSSDGMNDNILRVRLPMSSQIVTDALKDRGTVSVLEIDEYVGINQDAFKFSIPMFNVRSQDFRKVLKTENFNAEEYSNEDFSALASYGLMSENPFYYFSWYLYETGMTTSTISGGYKSLLLGQDNGGFFYNTKGNGEMKDFMDMRSLFTYTIPYLKQGNDLVKEWDDTYGIFIYDGVPTEEGHQNDPDILDNKELQQKYWHNLNVARLYNVYTPWVDVMYDCSYAKPEEIEFLGEKYLIKDPINPSSYPEERPMIFSKSEMVDYGLKENNLTKVEKLILECEEDMQERLFKLLNYNTFNDVVLNTAAAMNCTFAFNETFSENSIIGANHNIYPQSFELNDFSYDAYLRFILSNTTGESMIVSKNEVSNGQSFYSRITKGSSLTTVIVMLTLDIISVYVIPALKVFVIVGIFLLVILLILAEAFKVDEQQKFIKKLITGFVIPLAQFGIVTFAMACIVSLFMGEAHTSVTGSSTPSIKLGDPVMAMLAMIVVNGFVIYFYTKILLNIVKNIKSTSKKVGAFLNGLAGSIGGTISGSFGKALSSKGKSSSSRSSSGSSKGEDVGGVPNSRAVSRGSVIHSDKLDKSMVERERDDDIKPNTLERSSKAKKDSRKATQDIEAKTSKGLENIRGTSKKEN